MRTTFELFDFLIYTQRVFSFEICKYFMTWSSFRLIKNCLFRKNCSTDLIYRKKKCWFKKTVSQKRTQKEINKIAFVLWWRKHTSWIHLVWWYLNWFRYEPTWPIGLCSVLHIAFAFKFYLELNKHFVY